MTYSLHQEYAQPDVDVPLWAPLYRASAPDAVIRFFKKYAMFSGRASRCEYWWWVLVNGIVTALLYFSAVLAGINDVMAGVMIALGLLGAWLLATLVPGVALIVRRLHDANFSGWMALLLLFPILGGVTVLVFVLMDAKPGGQRFDQPAAF
jgi:uncharacterized membrane protein YhaH (DUF805 family)